MSEGAMNAAAAPAPAAAPSGSAAATSSTAPERGSPGTPSRQTKQDTPAPDAQAGEGKPAAAQPKTYEVKINGKVQRLSESELIARASMSEAADQKFREAAQLRKQAEAVIGKLRDPKQVIAALQDPSLGLSRDQIREQFEEWYATEFIDAEKLTPEQKKLKEAEARLKKYEQAEKDTEAAKAKAEQEAMTTKAREQVQGQIIEALESGKLPRTNFTIRRLAHWMRVNQSNGFEATTDQLIAQVRGEATGSLRELVEASDGDVLIQLLGDGVIQKLRKYDLEQLRKMRGGGQASLADQTQMPSDPARDRPLTSAEVNQRIRGLQKTGRF